MLKEIISTLEDNFEREPQNWFSTFLVGDPIQLQLEEIKFHLLKILENIIDSFSTSILSGEYIQNQSFLGEIEKIKLICSNLYEDTVLSDNTDLAKFAEAFAKIVEKVCVDYEEFESFVRLHISDFNVDLLFATDDEKNFNEEYYSLFSSALRVKHILISQLINLNFLDHFFDESNEYFKQLILVENRLNSPHINTPYIGAINEKLSFLKFKWVTRQSTTNEAVGITNPSRSYMYGKEVLSVQSNNEFSSQNDRLEFWKNYLVNHYNTKRNTDFYNKNFKKVAQTHDPNFLDVHFLIKYYKDVNPNYNNLVEVVESLESRKEEFKDDVELFNKNYNYALNNQFSLLVEKENVDEQAVISLKERIDSFQAKTGRDNFFVDFKYLSFLERKLSYYIENRKPLEVNSTGLKPNIDKIQLLINNCEEKIKWSQNHHNLLYQLPFEESVITYESNGLKVYYASSFLLPLSVLQVKMEFEKVKLEFQNKYSNYAFLSLLNKEFSVIKNLQESAKQSDKKSLETITIFTAVISFIVGTISGFKFIETFVQALIFILVFAFSLVNFVLLIFTSTKGIKRVQESKGTIISGYIAFFAALCVLFVYKHFIDDRSILGKEKLDNKQNVDSLYNVLFYRLKESNIDPREPIGSEHYKKIDTAGKKERHILEGHGNRIKSSADDK